MKKIINAVTLGRTNSGKSSLLNNLQGNTTLLVTKKAQTTRKNQLIKINGKCDYYFWDTPGFTTNQNYFEKYLTKTAVSKANEDDTFLLLVLFAADKPLNPQAIKFLHSFDHLSNKQILVLTKVDLVSKKDLITKVNFINESNFNFTKILKFSIFCDNQNYKDTFFDEIARTATKVHTTKQEVVANKSPVTNLVQFYARQWLAKHTFQEISHCTCLILDEIKYKNEKNFLFITGKLYCEKVNQRKILIGKNAQKIKALSIYTRTNLDCALNCQVYLKFEVVVWNHWRNDPNFFIKYATKL